MGLLCVACLFNAVIFACESRKKSDDEEKSTVFELRSVIAGIVLSDSEKFTHGLLGVSNEEYCAHIMKVCSSFQKVVETLVRCLALD